MHGRPVTVFYVHHAQRRQQGAAFTPDAMDAYLPRVVGTCREYLESWAAQDHISLVPAVCAPHACLQRLLELGPCLWERMWDARAMHAALLLQGKWSAALLPD